MLLSTQQLHSVAHLNVKWLGRVGEMPDRQCE